MPDGQKKFLIVDDHARFREVIRAFLPAGVVIECSNGDEALARYAVHRPDWVLMDIEMGGMDGLTATRRLKERFPEAHVIIISNHADEEIQTMAKAAGSEGFISKARLEDLLEIISDK